MNRRLQQFLTAENISQTQFAESIGVARANVSHILSGRNKPGFDFIEKMLTAYPALNLDWLITGKGKMYRNSYSNSAPNSLDNPNYSTNNQRFLFTPETVSDNNGAFSHSAQDDYSQAKNGEKDQPVQGDIFQSAMNYTSENEDFPSALSNVLDKAAESGSYQAGFNERSTTKRQSQRNSRSETKTFDNITNQISSQRVITKIIVYFSDNTFQELK